MPRPLLARLARCGFGLALPFLLISEPTAAQFPAEIEDSAGDETDGAAQFAELCARCHGLAGDGRGAEVLDRPARDFTAGGFSFGNTREAIARTIRFGIPGSPMPAFGETLAPERIEALARHVRTLAPGTEEPAEAETILSVREHPVVVRGGLPPITEGAPAHPRGLLLGLPGGLGFEYRVRDLALLGVRTGEFVRRADWIGRGGSSLEPLGQLLWLNENGTPRSTARSLTGPRTIEREDVPLSAVLRATRTPASGASIRWDALGPRGDLVAHVDEQLSALVTPLGSGFARRFRLSGPRLEALVLGQGVSPGRPEQLVDSLAIVVQREDGSFELDAALVDAGVYEISATPEHLEVTLLDGHGRPGEEETATITFVTLFSSEWVAPEPGALADLLAAELLR